MSDDERCSDSELLALARDPNPRVRSAAAELVALRRMRRLDSRRAEQIKRMRWAVENAIAKIETFFALAKQWESEEMPRPPDAGAEGT